MNIDGSNQTQVTRKRGGYPRYVTPDGKFLYHQSDFTNELIKVSLDDGSETPFGENLGYCQAFSPDGNRLAYLYKDHQRKHKINIMDLGTRKILKTLDGPKGAGFVSNLRWRNSNALGYSIDEINAKDSIWSQNLNDNFPQLLYEFSDADIMDIQFSADGRDIAFIRGGWRHDALLLKGLK